MPSSMKQIASCANATEAEQLRFVLEEHGIKAFIAGANVDTMMSHVGTALGGVRVLVSSQEAEEAAKILEAFREEPAATTEAWYCGKCKEQVDAGFEICWSCNGKREEVEASLPVNLDSDVGNSPQQQVEEPKTNPQAEEILKRAWRTAVIGSFLFPILLHGYSIYLLIRASLLTDRFTPLGNRRFYGSLVLSFLNVCLWWWLFRRVIW